MNTESNGLSEQLKKKLIRLLPQGYDAELARVVVASGQIQPVTELSDDDKNVLALAKEQGITAAGPDPITDGSPTLMRVVAWMCHEGVNGNGDAFVKEELQVAAGKVTPRNPLVMDWNHAAIVGGEGKVIGVWSKLDYAFDSKAKQGQGAWGLLAEGVMFAWCFPEISDAMLLEQQRNNKIDFSMACIPSSVEFAEVEGRRATILHNPVFFTLSGLDVAPGDKDAVGLAVEGDNSESVEQELRQQLVGAGASFSVANNGTGTFTAPSGATFSFDTTGLPWSTWVDAITTTGTFMRTAQMHVTIAFSLNKKADNQYEIVATAKDADGKEVATATHELMIEGLPSTAELAAAVTKSEELTATIAELNAEVAKLNGKIEEAATLLEASKNAHNEVTAALEALKAEKTELETQLAAKVAELEGASARLAEIDAARVEAERVARLEERLAELPAAYREAHAKREETRRVELEQEWSNMSDDTWTAKLEDINLALPQGGVKTASYLERSRREGVLPAGTTATDSMSIAERCQKFTRKSR